MYDTMGMQIEHTIIWHTIACLFMGSILCTQVLGSCKEWDESKSPKMYEETMGAPLEQCWKHHMEKMDNIQNNAYPKLGGYSMAYEINDAKVAC